MRKGEPLHCGDRDRESEANVTPSSQLLLITNHWVKLVIGKREVSGEMDDSNDLLIALLWKGSSKERVGSNQLTTVY